MQHDYIISNEREKDTNPDGEIITINKSKFIDDILDLIGVAFILGVFIGALITLILVNFSR